MSRTSFLPEYELLRLKGSPQEQFHERAEALARENFGRDVFVRGVVELSNFCRQNCTYCGMRRENRALERFRTNYEPVAEMLIHHRPKSITDINIQTGEDPVAIRDVVLPLIRAVRKETPLGISVCLGSLNPKLYAELQDAGASIYILKFETADEDHYRTMQSPGTLPERIQHIRHLANTGWRVSSGFIAGLPAQGPSELLANFRLAADLPLSGCSVSPFIPGDETPQSDAPLSDIDLTLNSMAALRLMRPDWVIPAVSALNLSEPESGYRRGLRTGANLVTINLTPSEVRADYLLYKRERFIMTEERILNAISAQGLRPSKIGLADFYRGQSAAEEVLSAPAARVA
ncbi:MAG: Radical domain protein [Verrucomicrobiales bacterium]|nr:Radical domain protein [Verrucomicrobiales bacterium]